MDKLPKFKSFLEEKEKADYFSVLDNELGIDPEIRKKIMQSEPVINTNLQIGNFKYKLADWEVVSSDDQGATIKLRNSGINSRTYNKDNSRYNGKNDGKMYRLNKEEFIKFLTSGWTPALQQAAGGDMGMGDPMAGAAPGGMEGGI
jgi:hypothetical protein